MKSKQILIGFEGNDRTGKDTLIDHIWMRLAKDGVSVKAYRNPDFPVRDLLLSKESGLDKLESFAIFWAGYHWIDRKIKEDGVKVALINRHVLSTLVYQNLATEEGKRIIHAMNSILPLRSLDKLIVTHISEEEYLRRLDTVENDGSRFESSNEEMKRRLKSYLLSVDWIANELDLPLYKEINVKRNDNFDHLTFTCKEVVEFVKGRL